VIAGVVHLLPHDWIIRIYGDLQIVPRFLYLSFPVFCVSVIFEFGRVIPESGRRASAHALGMLAVYAVLSVCSALIIYHEAMIPPPDWNLFFLMYYFPLGALPYVLLGADRA